MNLNPRIGLAATPVALAMTLAISIGASAEVATLVAPGETPDPAASDVGAATELLFADREEAILAFAQCMRDNGVDIDDPVPGERGGAGRLIRGGAGGGGGFDEFSQDFQIAKGACAPFLEAARPDIDLEAEQERLEEELAFAQCFRDNGYSEYPDPTLNSDGQLQRGGQAFAALGLDRRSAEFQDTRSLCADQLGLDAFGGRPGAGLGGGNNS